VAVEVGDDGADGVDVKVGVPSTTLRADSSTPRELRFVKFLLRSVEKGR